MALPPGWGPGHPEYEAKVAADIARLQGAKGIQLGAWIRANKILVIVFGVYIALVVGAGIVFQHPGASIIAVFWVPIVGLRLWLRSSRR
jgi:hypothetical protein